MKVSTIQLVSISFAWLLCSANALADTSPDYKLSTWRTLSGLSNNAESLLTFIQSSQQHGLNPEAYGYSTLRQDNAWQSPVLFDQHMDSAFSTLIKHLGSGVVSAIDVQVDLYRAAPQPEINRLRQAVERGNLTVQQVITQVTPQHTDYQRLVIAMAKLLDEKASARSRTQIRAIQNLAVGTRHNEIMPVKRRLIDLGDLPRTTVLTPMFDAPLLIALQSVQQRHGLQLSGLLDIQTVAALNTNIDQQIEKLALSLERWRWMPRDMGERHIVINLPEYRLRMMNGEQKIVDMPVIVGSPKHKTPVFSNAISYLEVAPTWTVPASITEQELIPLERRYPGYLLSNGFEFVIWKNGKQTIVPAEQMEKADFDKNPFHTP